MPQLTSSPAATRPRPAAATHPDSIPDGMDVAVGERVGTVAS